MDDKYIHIRLIEQSSAVDTYAWLDYTINHLIPGYGKYFWTLHHPNDTNLGHWFTSLQELDQRLEELWNQNLSKVVHSDWSI